MASLISYPSGTVCQGFTSSSCQSSCPLWSAGASWAAGTVWGMYGISASAARAVGASTRTAVSRAPQRVRIFFRMFISFLSGRGRPSDLLCSVFYGTAFRPRKQGRFCERLETKRNKPSNRGKGEAPPPREGKKRMKRSSTLPPLPPPPPPLMLSFIFFVFLSQLRGAAGGVQGVASHAGHVAVPGGGGR